MPSNFLFFGSGGGVTLLWDPPASGPAPTSYLLNVSGAFSGSFLTSSRSLTAPAPAGSYTVSVSAANACGVSAPTAPQTVVMQ